MCKLKEVVVEVTRQCTLDCIHCGSDCGHKAAEGELSASEWENVLFQLSLMGVEKVVFSGGEPTLKKGFGNLLLYASNLGLKVGFISNGLVPFKQELLESISQSKPFAVGLSVDGLKDTHNLVRRNKGSWQGLMQNIALLQELDVQICAVTTLHKLNFQELARLANFLEMVEMDSWQLQLAMPSGRMREQSALLISEEEFRRVCREVTALRRLHPKINIQAADCFGVAPAGTIRSGYWTGCTAGVYSMGIDACGNIMPCLSLQDGQRGENIKGKSVAEIWNNSSVFDFNRKFAIENVEGRCKDCHLLVECRGGCSSQSLAYFGRLHSSPFCYHRSFVESDQGGKRA